MHLKTNTDPYSMTQDSTLDTPQRGVWDNFFYPFQWEWETQKTLKLTITGNPKIALK